MTITRDIRSIRSVPSLSAMNVHIERLDTITGSIGVLRKPMDETAA